jgi:hypothetical protein
MSNLLEQYYKGITQQLRAEVDLINSLFQHQGIKGEGNETALRDFLTNFVPKQYGVGTGVVIDRDGKPSGQCDVVVYDDLSYPTFFSLTASHLFPIDIVRVVIEVKTTLDASKAKIARENIVTLRTLSVPEQFGDPPPLSRETTNGRRVYDNWKYSPPSGCVFAYDSSVKGFETFKNWFMPDSVTSRPKECPTLVGCLDQGIVRFRNTYPRDDEEPEGYTFPVRDEHGEIVKPSEAAGQWQDYNGIRYPVKQVGNENILVDQSRTLLLFSLYLYELVRIKRPNPRTELPIHYLSTLEQSALVV